MGSITHPNRGTGWVQRWCPHMICRCFFSRAKQSSEFQSQNQTGAKHVHDLHPTSETSSLLRPLIHSHVLRSVFTKLPSTVSNQTVSVLHRDTEVQVGDLPVNKVEGVCERAAVELGFDPLRMGVQSQLLAGVLGNQEECVALWVGDLEFVSAKGADLLCGGVRVNHQGFACAARVQLLEGDPEKVLQNKSSLVRQRWSMRRFEQMSFEEKIRVNEQLKLQIRLILRREDVSEEEGSHAVKVKVLHAVSPLRCAFYYKKSSSELDPHAALFLSGFMDIWTHCLDVQVRLDT